MYNLFFEDLNYNKDKIRAGNIIRRLGERIMKMENLEKPDTDEISILENIESKKLIIKILKYQFNL